MKKIFNVCLVVSLVFSLGACSSVKKIFKKKKNCSPKEFRENFRLKKKVI